MLFRLATLCCVLIVSGCELFAPAVPCKVDDNCPEPLYCGSNAVCLARPPPAVLVDSGRLDDDAGRRDDDAGRRDDDAGAPDGGRRDGGAVDEQRIRIAIDSAGVTELVANLPVLVRPPDAVPDDAALRFTDADGGSVPFEIEAWGSGAARAIWVLLPTLAPGDDDAHLWLIFGGSGPPSSRDPTEVWQNGYVGVWHLADPPAPGALARDSASGLHGTYSASMTAQNAADGVIGGALRFTGAEHVTIGNDALLRDAALREDLVVEAWVQTSGDLTQDFVSKMGGNGQRGWDLTIEVYPVTGGLERGLTFRTSGDGSAVTYTGYPLLETARWYHVVGTFSSSTRTTLYLDGELDGELTSEVPASLFDTDASLVLGRAATPAVDYLVGLLDEVRLARGSRSESWLHASHRAMTGDLVSYGAVEALP